MGLSNDKIIGWQQKISSEEECGVIKSTKNPQKKEKSGNATNMSDQPPKKRNASCVLYLWSRPGLKECRSD